MIKRLRESGFTDTQAEAVSALVQEASAGDLSHLATKTDLRELEVRLEAKIETSAAHVKAEILRWMFSALAAQTALIIGLTKLIH
ncbi:MAG: hypothetical protein WCF85_18535 [Rhodospirillaceae bacterium]